MMGISRYLLFGFSLMLILNPPHAGESSQNIINQPLLLAPPGYVARIKLNNPNAVEDALERAENFFTMHEYADNLPAIVFILHGPEVEIFNRNNYNKYKSIVDLAARLHAFKVINIKVCKSRMEDMGEYEENLFPFVGTVPYGPAEIKRLVNDEDFLYF